MFSKLKSVFAGSNPMPAAPDTVQTSDRTWSKEVANLYRFRKGMWVNVPTLGIGILTNVFDDSTVLVMLVDGDGFNKLAVTKHATGIRQAKLSEIPPSRRPDSTVARNLGYA